MGSLFSSTTQKTPKPVTAPKEDSVRWTGTRNARRCGYITKFLLHVIYELLHWPFMLFRRRLHSSQPMARNLPFSVYGKTRHLLAFLPIIGLFTSYSLFLPVPQVTATSHIFSIRENGMNHENVCLKERDGLYINQTNLHAKGKWFPRPYCDKGVRYLPTGR